MKNKNILVTGGLGFIGINFIQQMLQKYKYNIINLDKITYASNKLPKEFEKRKNYTFVKGDICDKKFLETVFIKYDITDVIHFAAETHVDNSISNPNIFMETNIIGTHNLLNVAYSKWFYSPFKSKNKYKNSKFHHISTDEVYGTLPDDTTKLFKESTPYSPNSPYSASKASSDMIVKSYFHTFGMNINISNCSNNYGPYQHKEKLIPKIINNALNGEIIPIYGNGKNIRDWLFVEDHCIGIDTIFHNGKNGESYNIGGQSEKTNNDIVITVCEILDKLKPKKNSYKELIRFVEDRPGHDKRYAIDITKINKKLNWKPKVNFEDGIKNTIKWYINQ